MNHKDYIESGLLEMYVYGALSEEESIAVSEKLEKFPEVKKEVEQIERALHYLGTATAPYNPEDLLQSIKQKIENSTATPIIEPRAKESRNWLPYFGWAASLLLAIGLFALMSENTKLQDRLQTVSVENTEMESKIENALKSIEKTRQLLNVFRDQGMIRVGLKGQKIAPEAYASVIWNKEKKQTFIDAKDLPSPPPGKVYQVWSLTLNPLKPTSIGLLKNFEKDKNKIFVLSNPNASQAFGITLEPAGGSETPTMEQLYVLGVVKAES